MEKNKHISVALEKETYDRLQELAHQDIRPISNLVRHIIKMYIKAIDKGDLQLSSRSLPR